MIFPENVDPNEEYPVLVLLHVSGEVGKNEQYFLSHGVVKAVSETDLATFNGYIICPHLTGGYNSRSWCNSSSESSLRGLLENFTATHNVDMNNIAVAGHSLGGQGTVYMAGKMDDWFNKAAVLSGYNQSAVKSTDIEIDVRAYVGKSGEDSQSIKYTKGILAEGIGNENVYEVDMSHSNVPQAVFNIDDDGNGLSDIFEWLFDK